MSDTFILQDVDIERARMLRNEVQKLRIWFAGYEAAGKSTPPGTEVLWQLMMIFDQSMQSNAIRNLEDANNA